MSNSTSTFLIASLGVNRLPLISCPTGKDQKQGTQRQSPNAQSRRLFDDSSFALVCLANSVQEPPQCIALFKFFFFPKNVLSKIRISRIGSDATIWFGGGSGPEVRERFAQKKITLRPGTFAMCSWL